MSADEDVHLQNLVLMLKPGPWINHRHQKLAAAVVWSPLALAHCFARLAALATQSAVPLKSAWPRTQHIVA